MWLNVRRKSARRVRRFGHWLRRSQDHLGVEVIGLTRRNARGFKNVKTHRLPESTFWNRSGGLPSPVVHNSSFMTIRSGVGPA
jgi:hypothetical protein